MTGKIMLCFSTGEAAQVLAAQLYWAQEDDGGWQHTIKDIADHFGLPSSQISKAAKENATAFILTSRCTSCGTPHTASSRADFSQLPTGSLGACSHCLTLKRQTEERRSAELRKIQQERQNAIWLRETSSASTFDYYALDYLDSCYAFVILVNSELNEISGEINLIDSELFSPDPEELTRVVTKLHNCRMLLFGKRTKLDAFLPGDDDDQSYRYYPARISWRFAPSKHGDSYQDVLAEVSDIVDSRDGDVDYIDTVTKLWWHIGQAEGLRYLKKQFDSYRLAVPEGDKLQQGIRHVLNHYSIPCMRNLIWRLAKETAAYAARRDIHIKRAMNSVPGSLIRMCDRALADGWDIKPYVLKWDEEESLLTTTLFDRILGTGMAGFKVTTGETVKAMALTKTPD